MYKREIVQTRTCTSGKNLIHQLFNTLRNLRSTSNVLIAIETGCLILYSNTTPYYTSLMISFALGFSPFFCFTAYCYVRFINYYTPTMTFVVALDRYIHVKYAIWYEILQFLIIRSQVKVIFAPLVLIFYTKIIYRFKLWDPKNPKNMFCTKKMVKK